MYSPEPAVSSASLTSLVDFTSMVLHSSSNLSVFFDAAITPVISFQVDLPDMLRSGNDGNKICSAFGYLTGNIDNSDGSKRTVIFDEVVTCRLIHVVDEKVSTVGASSFVCSSPSRSPLYRGLRGC